MSFEEPKPDRPTVIITDDRRASRHMIRNILKPEGYKLIEAENGKVALELCQKSAPDLLLLDIVMPVMDGLEACSRLNSKRNDYFIPVLMFTAYNDGSEVEKSFQAGASDFINKPIDPEELRHRVKRLLYLSNLEKQRRADEKKLQASYEKIQLLSRKVLRAYEEERVRLARELHDEVGMSLTTLKLNLQLYCSDIAANNREHKEKLGVIVKSIDELQRMIRDKAYFLRPPSLDELGLLDVVNNMIIELSKSTGIQGTLALSGSPEIIPVDVETALYRCIQEALTNAARHSGADNISVGINFSNEQITVNVTDDGIGFVPDNADSAGKHLGLQGMQERIDLLGGSLEIRSAPGEGTDIRIIVPLGAYYSRGGEEHANTAGR